MFLNFNYNYALVLAACTFVTSTESISELLFFNHAFGSGSVATTNSPNCTSSEFQCESGHCVPLAKRCDDHGDCIDHSDEKDCEMVKCQSPVFFRCKNGRCVSSSFVCNGENDCEDFSDEVQCDAFKKLLKANATATKCQEGQWQCTDKLCIPQEWVCNGDHDCLDGSDEIIGCSAKLPCEDGFRCKNDHCIISEWRCDGNDDCHDNSDEEDCASLVTADQCSLDQKLFLCKDNSTCIDIARVCDNKPHCPDRSDEGPLCVSKTETCENHNCTHDCVQMPWGPKCLCPSGYQTLDDRNCKDIDECQTYGICDQKCKNLAGSYKCLCNDGYSLQQDSRTCKTTGIGEPILVFSTKSEIRAFELRSEVYYSISKNLRQAVGVKFDGKYVYWTDIYSEHESLMRSNKDGSDRELLITSGLGAPEDLDVDFITGNIYFTDAERRHIGICNNDASLCTVLVNKDIHKPRGIVLHPDEGKMFWSDWGKNPEIASSQMDGSMDTSFVSNDIHWPNGLAIDFAAERLYWTDAKLSTLESINLDGTDRRVVLKGVALHPYAIAVFEERIFWSDWATHSIQSCDKYTGKNHHTLIKDKRNYIYGLSIHHPNLHNRKNVHNPCDGQSCSDICLISGKESYACACPQGKMLSTDRHSCKVVDRTQALILGFENMLVRVEHQVLGRHDLAVLPVVVKKVTALAYNGVDNVVYVSDGDIRKIVKLEMHSGDSAPLEEIGELGHVVAMDYDPLGNNLYWCDSQKNTVEVFNFNTKSRRVLIHDMHDESPQSIALIPSEGVMFVAFKDHIKNEAHIDRILMDGTSRTHPLESGLLGPIDLHYDPDVHRVFFSDSGTGNIESTSSEGDDRHGFRSLQSYPIGIASLKNDLFWVNENSKRIFWSDKYDTSSSMGHNKKITLDLPLEVDRMFLISATPRSSGSSPCHEDNAGCSHLCLHVHKSAVCSCPNSMGLGTDNRTCVQRLSCEAHEFLCLESNRCIATKSRCDGVRDCQHGEDEADCSTPHHCASGDFQCQDLGQCVPMRVRCDGNLDCRDKSDERNCSGTAGGTCGKGHFECADSSCISERFICDGKKDCGDGEDEVNCVETTCEPSEFRCTSGTCIHKEWRCDHEYDCLDSSDEENCPKCPDHMFTCKNGKCLDPNLVCDAEDDCGDDSDEVHCTLVKLLTGHNASKCPQGQFQCFRSSLECLPETAKCNGTSECPHHEDESDCSDCHVDDFVCADKKCIPIDWICDHNNDCSDGSDEDHSLCERHQQHDKMDVLVFDECSHGKFRCKNGHCVDFKLVCNNESNCFDGSDEDGSCATSCNHMNNPCSQLCQKSPTGPICACREGFRLLGDGKTCEDIDECSSTRSPRTCSQICHNGPGSFTCDCYQGFNIRNDKVSCKAEGLALSLLFTTDLNQIREVSQMNNSLRLVHNFEGVEGISGLDYDYATGSVFISIENSGTIIQLINNKTNLIENVGQPQRIAYDWISKNLYMVNSDDSYKSITVCNFEARLCSKLINNLDSHRQISQLVVDPINKVIFYTQISWWMFNSPSFVLYRSNLDGTNTKELVKSTKGHITGLSYDYNRKELFYVDQHSAQLGKINYDGSGMSVIKSNLTGHPTGLNFFEDHLYFLSGGGTKRHLQKCRLFGEIWCETLPLSGNSVDLFVLEQKSRQPDIENGCLGHNCSHICVPTADHPQFDYHCLCDDGTLTSPLEEKQKCSTAGDSVLRESDQRRIQAQFHDDFLASNLAKSIEDHNNVGPMIAGILISVCILVFAAYMYYFIKKRHTGNFNIIMRFSNGYNIHGGDDSEKTILTTSGQKNLRLHHEVHNPIYELYDEEEKSGSRKGTSTSGTDPNLLLVNA